jgi:hypothetical protein
MQEILNIVKTAEAKTVVARSKHERRRKRKASSLKEPVEQVVKSDLESLDSDCIVVTTRK